MKPAGSRRAALTIRSNDPSGIGNTPKAPQMPGPVSNSTGSTSPAGLPPVTLRGSAYLASKGLSPFCRQSFGMTSRFSSRLLLLSAAMAPPVIFPFAVVIVARNGFIPL